MKKKQKTQYLQGITGMIPCAESSAFLLVGIEALHDHSVGLNAFGCSISRPDMSQSNCCQVSCFTSNWFLGQRNLPWTSSKRKWSEMLAFSNDYYGLIFRATQSVELFCAYVSSASAEINLYFLMVNLHSYLIFCNKKGGYGSFMSHCHQWL